MRLVHTFEPVWNNESRILILGSFPSVKSREEMFYYGHPYNRFWKVLAELASRPLPQTIDEKRALLLNNHIALWDVCAACEIEGSSDSSIRSAVPNDILPILTAAKIECICTNGKTADRLYRKLILPNSGIESICLPSTSPANMTWPFPKLAAEWQSVLTKYLLNH